MAKTRNHTTPGGTSHPLPVLGSNLAEQAFEGTIENLYPLFQEWVKKTKGWHMVDGIYLIKAWYEFLEWTKEVK